MAILPAREAQFEYTIPVVIIGAGACGLTAALAAKESGAEVLVLERDAKPSGSTALSTGLIPAAGTRLQAAKGIQDSPALLAEDIWKKAKGQTDRTMVEAVAQASGPTIDWLMGKHQVELVLVEGFLYPGHSALRMHGTPARTGGELEAALLAAAGRADVDIITSATATDLYAEADGRIVAVRFQRPDGSHETVGCEALVLASCGYGGNKELVRKYIPEIADAEFWGHVGNKGDAIVWAEQLGVAVADLGSYQGHGAVAHPYGNPINWGAIQSGAYLVNKLGKRFSHESRGYSEQAVDTISQPDHFAWEIFDARCEAPIKNFTDYVQVESLGGIKSADTLAELASILGLPADALEATNREVDEMRAGKRACPFGRDFTKPEVAQPLKAPFRGVKVTGALFHTQGGIVIDPSARALRNDRTPMPNLYAGGGAARGLAGPGGWGYFSGGGLLTATTLGRIAGLSAAKQVLGK
jgi:fumarate reductase flavoprotein subunit